MGWFDKKKDEKDSFRFDDEIPTDEELEHHSIYPRAKSFHQKLRNGYNEEENFMNIMNDIRDRQQRWKQKNILEQSRLSYQYSLAIEIYTRYTETELLRQLNFFLEHAQKTHDMGYYDYCCWKCAMLLQRQEAIRIMYKENSFVLIMKETTE